jgi:hypothetical protein
LDLRSGYDLVSPAQKHINKINFSCGSGAQLSEPLSNVRLREMDGRHHSCPASVLLLLLGSQDGSAREVTTDLSFLRSRFTFPGVCGINRFSRSFVV